MRFGVPWSVKGVRPEARETAREAARRSGMSLGEWLNSVILEQADEDGLHGGHEHDDHESYAQDLASVHQRLDEITRRLTQFSRPGPEAYAPKPYAPKQSRNEEPDRIAELIARLDQRIGDDELREFQLRIRPRDERGARSRRLGPAEKIVPVALLRANRHEHLARAELPRVHRETSQQRCGNCGPATTGPRRERIW